jgi:hypothetical protein
MTLLKDGVNLTRVSEEGKTALDYAGENPEVKGTVVYEALRAATKR